MADDAAAASCPAGTMRKRAENRLVVEEAKATTDEYNSLCTLHPATDVILLKGKRRCDTVCMALSDKEYGEGNILIGKVARSNFRVRLVDVVSVHPCHDARYGPRVHVLPLDDTIEGLLGDLF